MDVWPLATDGKSEPCALTQPDVSTNSKPFDSSEECKKPFSGSRATSSSPPPHHPHNETVSDHFGESSIFSWYQNDGTMRTNPAVVVGSADGSACACVCAIVGALVMSRMCVMCRGPTRKLQWARKNSHRIEFQTSARLHLTKQDTRHLLGSHQLNECLQSHALPEQVLAFPTQHHRKPSPPTHAGYDQQTRDSGTYCQHPAERTLSLAHCWKTSRRRDTAPSTRQKPMPPILVKNDQHVPKAEVWST